MKELLNNANAKMLKSVDKLKEEFSSLRAGRANPGVLDKISVDYYGAPTPINQMAAVSVAEARILLIQPWDVSSLKDIERAILSSDLGITPKNDGKVIRLEFPSLTEDRRRELVKDVHKMAEECKVAVRNIRREAIDKIKAMQKKSEITEDELKNGEKKIQQETDDACKRIDEVTAEKEKELMSI